jgi:hypothetical protein
LRVPIENRDRVVARPGAAPPRRRPPSGDGPRRPERPQPRPRQHGAARARRRLVALALVVVISVIALAGVAAFAVSKFEKLAPTCTATIADQTYHLDREQAANARTISEVAAETGVPNHAVTVALAAAFQESNLHNINHGDRDSVGLFQQRPSQGWGSPEQLTTPRYAALAFYRALERVDGWESMSVTDAAQHVQRSAAPDAYAKWESEARVLARILTGEVPNRLVCD